MLFQFSSRALPSHRIALPLSLPLRGVEGKFLNRNTRTFGLGQGRSSGTENSFELRCFCEDSDTAICSVRLKSWKRVFRLLSRNETENTGMSSLVDQWVMYTAGELENQIHTITTTTTTTLSPYAISPSPASNLLSNRTRTKAPQKQQQKVGQSCGRE